jgi:hypothetical protein
VAFNNTMVDNKDSDGDGDGDFEDPHPNNFQLNDLFIYNVELLYGFAQDYVSSIPLPTIDRYGQIISSYPAPSKYSFKTAEWLVFTFIKYNLIQDSQRKYTVGNWIGTSGSIDYYYNFIQAIKNNHNDLYTYFEKTSLIQSCLNEYNIDVYHMAATITALLYQSDFTDGDSFIENLEFQFMFDENLDHLAGWAGDMTTQIRECDKQYRNLGISFEQCFKRCLGDDNSLCGITDLNSDADAVNIAYMIRYNNSNLSDILKSYYTYDFKYRFTLLVENANIDKKTIKLFTNKHFMLLFKWPTYNDNTDTHSEISCEIFWTYFNAIIQKENNM